MKLQRINYKINVQRALLVSVLMIDIVLLYMYRLDYSPCSYLMQQGGSKAKSWHSFQGGKLLLINIRYKPLGQDELVL